MDDYQVFDRTNGVLPFLLLDGHRSRFELPILEYINNDEHKWRVCIGVPYGINIWQVGDSAKQNGSFKMAIVWAKTNLLQKKAEACLPFAIEKTDVILVVHMAWRESFAIVVRNKKVIAERGWGPLNFILLDHPELKKVQEIVNGVNNAYEHFALTGMVPISPSDLIMDNGMAGTFIEYLWTGRAIRGQETSTPGTMPMHVLTVLFKRCRMP